MVGSADARTSQNIAYVNYDDSGFTNNFMPGGNIFFNAIIGSPTPTSSNATPVTYNGMTFTPLKRAELSSLTLAGFDTLILFQICDINISFNSAQQAAINKYLTDGNKILLFDSDRCAEQEAGIANYSWFKYPFTTSAPGPRGAIGNLSIVENSDLTNGLQNDPFDKDELGDANTATTNDLHWFAAAMTNNTLGNNGFFLAYARNITTDRGLIIYNGADYWFTIGNTTSLTHMFVNMLNQKFDPDNLPSRVPVNLHDFKQNLDKNGNPVPWADETLFDLTNNCKIKDCGSQITSLADVLLSYKINLPNTPMNPGNLNEYLALNPVTYSSTENSIDWVHADDLLGFTLVNYDLNSTPLVTRIQHINEALAARNLVIAGIKGTSGQQHYVVFYNKMVTNASDGSPDYLIADPYNYSTIDGDRSGKTLSDAYKYTINQIAGNLEVTVINNSAPQPGGSWSIFGHSPIQILITDPNGAQTGFDPATNSNIQNIPGSIYGVRQGVGDDSGENSPPPDVLYFGLNTVLKGAYNVQVIGTGSGPYKLDFSSVSSSGDSSQQTINGTAQTGKTDTFVVTVQSGELTKIQPVGYIINPGFENGKDNWTFYTNGTGTFNIISPGYEGTKAAQLVLNTAGTNVQLYQKGLTLEPDTRYRLSFAAYSTSGHDLNVDVFKHGSPYTNYGLSQRFNLGTSWQTFTTEFTTKGFTGLVNDARFMLYLAPFATAGDTYYFDNVRLEKIKGGLIGNPGFESGYASWLFYTNGTGSFNVISPGYEGTNAAQLVLNSEGTNVQLYQKGLSLEPDTRYRLSFAAYSTSGDDLSVVVFKHGSPYANFGLDQTFNLSTSWQVFTTEFTTKGFTGTVDDVRLMFYLAPYATGGDIYYIDDVRLEKT